MPTQPLPPTIPGSEPIPVLLARLEERVAALETAIAGQQAATAEEHDDLSKRQADIDRLAWAVKHGGRKRPW